MKYLFFILLALPLTSLSQEKEIYYRTLSPLPFIEIFREELGAGKLDSPRRNTTAVPDANTYFTKLRIFNNDYFLIEFWNYTNDEESKEKFNLIKSAFSFTINGVAKTQETITKKYFLLAKTYLENDCEKVIPKGFYGAQLAVTTVPFKLRLKNFDFYSSQTLGLALNFRKKPFTKSDFYINGLFGLNLSFVNLDSFTTKGIVSGQPINNVGVLSPMAGVVFEFHKVQLGFMLGFDLMNKSNLDKYKWIYNGKPWLGIGLGISILNFQADKVKENDLSQKKSP